MPITKITAAAMATPIRHPIRLRFICKRRIRLYSRFNFTRRFISSASERFAAILIFRNSFILSR